MPAITDSSHLTGAEWENGILTISFSGGTSYEYYDVPYAVLEELMSAQSKGKFLQTEIRGKYQSARI